MRRVYGWSIVGVICTCAASWGQAPVDPPRTTVRPLQGVAPGAATAATAVPVGRGTTDQEIAATLWVGAHNEVELAKIAQKQAQSEAVKDFAVKMMKDHSQQAEKLQRTAGHFVNSTAAHSGAGVETRREVRKPVTDGTTRPDERKEVREERRAGREEPKATNDREKSREGREATREVRPEEREVRATSITVGQPGLNWVAIHREVGERCLASATKELTSKSGHEFDMCYMGMQLGAHMHMLDHLQVLKNYATSDFQQNIEECIATTEDHLSAARQILNEIKDDGNRADGFEFRGLHFKVEQPTVAESQPDQAGYDEARND